MRTKFALSQRFSRRQAFALQSHWHRSPRPRPDAPTTAPNTTQCETNGSAAIVTSPQQNNYYGGWPWGGGFVIGIGGWGWGW